MSEIVRTGKGMVSLAPLLWSDSSLASASPAVQSRLVERNWVRIRYTFNLLEPGNGREADYRPY